jgi:drug/metabolite transporter (DMT)-like permease
MQLSRQSDGALISLALIWGTSHVITKDILTNHSPAFYTSARFSLAALCFSLIYAGHLWRSDNKEIKEGIILGLCSFAGIAFYVAGMVFTQASKAGFITGLYLVFTPVLSFFLFNSRPAQQHLAGLAVAICGFVLLSFPRQGEGINWGDLLIFLAALAWSLHISATSSFARRTDIRRLAAIQVMIVAVMALLVYFFLKILGMETSRNQLDWGFGWRIFYMAILVTFVAALIQTWAQGKVSSTYAVIFYALEPATAAIFAYLYLGEKLSISDGVGAVLIVAGVMISRLSLTTHQASKP